MNHVTLVLSRFPLDEFIWNQQTGENIDDVDNLGPEERQTLYRLPKGGRRTQISGQWGTMAMVIGPRITYAGFNPPASAVLRNGNRTEQIDLSVGRKVHLVLDGDGEIESMKLFTTVERYRTDDGKLNEWGFGYVRMLSRSEPYTLQNETNNSTVKKYLKRGNGDCIRVLGGATLQQQAILIHDTPHVGFVVGCIGPRPWNDRKAYSNVANNPSDKTVQEIMSHLGRRHGKGTLYVLKNL
jgi:hypothetical protein